REAIVVRADRALCGAQRRGPRPLLRAHAPPHLARRALLVVVHDAHAQVPEREPDRGEAARLGARVRAEFGSGAQNDRRELRRAAPRLRRSVMLASHADPPGARRDIRRRRYRPCAPAADTANASSAAVSVPPRVSGRSGSILSHHSTAAASSELSPITSATTGKPIPPWKRNPAMIGPSTEPPR